MAAATKPRVDTDDPSWTAPKFVVLGLLTLAAAFGILHVLSGTDCIPGFC